MNYQSSILAGTALGVAAALVAILATFACLRVPTRYRFLSAFGPGAAILFLVWMLDALGPCLLGRLYTDLGVRRRLVYAAVAGGVVTGAMLLPWLTRKARVLNPATRAANQLDLSLTLSDVLTSTAGAWVFAAIAYVAILPVLPSTGSLLGGLGLGAAGIAFVMLGFVSGHVLWLVIMARGAHRSKVMDAMRDDSSFLGRVSRLMVAMLLKK